MSHRAVILAGGQGTRLAPYTTVFPKPLMPIGDTPVLEIVLRQLARAGFGHVTLAVGHLAELIEAFFGDGSKVGLELDYSREEEPLGTAGPLALIGDLHGPFLVMNGDVLTTLNYERFLSEHVESGAIASVATAERIQRIDFGIVVSDEDDRIIDYVEKPEYRYRVSMGVYAFSADVLGHIERGERLDFPDLVHRLIAADEHVRAVTADEYWLDIGRHDDFAQAQEDFDRLRDRLLGEES